LPIATLGMLAFLVNGDSRAVAPLLIDIAADFGVHLDRTAVFVSAYMICFGISTLIVGPLGDRFGRARVIQIAAISTSFFSLISAIVPNFDGLIMARAVNGATAAGILPVGMALIGEHYTDGVARQAAISKVMGLMFLGGASAMVIGGSLAHIGSWRLVYATFGVAELALSGMLVIQLRGLPPSARVEVLNGLKAALHHRRLLQTVGVMTLVGFSVIGSFVFTGIVVQRISGLGVLGIGLVLSAFGVGALIGGRATPLLRRHLGRSFFVWAAALGGLSLGLLSATGSVAIVIAALVLFGAAFVAWQSTLVFTVQSLLPKWRGVAMSFASFAMSTGGGLGAWANGRMLAHGSLEAVYVLAACLLLVAGMLAFWVIPVRLPSADS